MEFRILGPLEVSTGDGPLPLGGRRQRLVLAHLLIRANEVVPTEVLIDEVWGDEPPDSVRSTLQGYLSHLRRAVGDRLEGRTPGYVLHVEGEELDAAAFERRVREAKRSQAFDPAAAANGLAEALALWRGPAFADLSEEPSLRGEIARLDELRLSATEHRIAAELALGGHSTVVSELESLTARYPLRERMWGNLMLARYRLGRQAEALSTYERARGVLADELGVEPSAELQQLHERILRRDPALGRPEPARPSVRPSRIDLQPGTEFAGYRIVRTLGRGGMSVVYLAEHEWLQRKVALKVLAPQLAEDDRFRERFVRESRLAASLDHPNVIPIYEAGGSGGDLFIAMRFVEGSDLRSVLNESGALEPGRALEIVRQVAAALDAAHEQGLVHRDVKPGNVLLAQPRGSETHEHVYLSDFGLTKRSASDSGVTGTGQFVGTLDYAAPEQFQGGTADAHTDVYSLGCVLFECLTGRPPFRAENDAGLMYAHLQQEPPAVTSERPELPAAIDDVVLVAMAKTPSERQGSAGAMAMDAARALGLDADARVSGPPRTLARRLIPAFAVVAALVAGIVAASFIRGESAQLQDQPASDSPSPEAESVFATVERPLSAEEERLLGYIPAEAAIDCLPFDREARPEVLAAIVCRPPEMEVLYELFAERSSMDERFQINANIQRAPDGECATDTLAVSPYAIGGEEAGRVLCYTTTAQTEAFSRRLAGSHIEWTTENNAIYAHAVRSDLSDLTLYEWWLSSSGPVLDAGSTESVAKDRPPIAGVAPPGDGSYLLNGPFEGTTTTFVMRIDGTTYEIQNVLETGPFDQGAVSLRKPASMTFTPTAGYCFRPGQSTRPARYSWTGSGDRISFEHESGGGCAGPYVGAWTSAPEGMFALESGEDIGLMDTGGTFVDKLTNLLPTRPNFWPDWSPDGSRIVFAGQGDAGFDLYVMNADGTDVARITDLPGDEFTPAWSPDGSRIAFAFASGNIGDAAHRTGISVVSPDGSGVTELVARTEGSFDAPHWSPDGSRVAFTDLAPTGQVSYVVDADGGDLAEVRALSRALSWTLDGRRIILAAHGSIRSVRPDGSGDQVISRYPPENGELVLDYSPDGQWFVMSSRITRIIFTTAVYLMRADGSDDVFQIGLGSEPSWRPEG